MKNRIGWSFFTLLISTTMVLMGAHLLSLSSFSQTAGVLAQSNPNVEQVDPTYIVNTAETSITVSGTDFAAVVSGTQIITRPLVLLNGDALPDVGWVSSTTLTSTVPAGYPVGIYDVTVQNPDDLTGTLSSGLVVQYPTPQLTAVHPLTATYGQPLTLTLTGSAFISTPVVYLGNTILPVVDYISSTLLTTAVPITIPPGIYDLTVQNPGPGDVSDWAQDAFTLYSPIPSVSQIEPQKIYNDMDTPIVINGANFAPTPQVMLGNTPLENVTWISMTQLTAQIPWGMVPGTYALTMTNPAPGAYRTMLSDALTITQGFDTWTTGGPYGGHIQEMAVHPLLSNTLYAVASNVGIFASTNGAETWEMILREDWLTRISFDAENPNVIYIGGDGNLLRTMDGGLTWAEISPSLEPWTKAVNLYRPLAHPTTSCVLYTGKRTPDEPDTEAGGVYWSDDCGTTWEKWGEESSGLTDTHVTELAFHPTDGNILLAGTQNGNIFRSDDAGRNWSWQARIEPQIAKITFNPFGDHEAWLLTRMPMGLSDPPYVYTSTNLTEWTAVVVSTGSDQQPATDIEFIDANTIWAGSGYGLISNDGGATWTEVSNWSGVLAGDGAVSAAVDHDMSDVIYAGHFQGGVSTSTDGGASWQHTSEGLAGVIPHALAIAPDDPETLYAYTTRGVLKSQNGGVSWQSLDKSIGGWSTRHMLATDPFIPDRIYLMEPCEDAFCLLISEDGAETWRQVTSTIPAEVSGYASAINTISPHPTDAGRIYAGVSFYPNATLGEPTHGGIFVSEDYGEQWEFLASTDVLSAVEEIAYDAVNPNLLYAGTRSKGIWRSSNGGTNWQQLIVPGMVPPISVGALATHPDRANVILAQLLSFAETSNPDTVLYISENAGQHWVQLDDGTSGGGLWFAPPAANMPPYMLYTSCDRSACRSFDTGSSWNVVYGVPRPSAMASATDGERIVLYAASPGGMAALNENNRLLARDGVANSIPGLGNVLGSGVYRTTISPLNQHIYLPMITQGQ